MTNEHIEKIRAALEFALHDTPKSVDEMGLPTGNKTRREAMYEQALTHLSALEEGMGWQPMATAPIGEPDMVEVCNYGPSEWFLARTEDGHEVVVCRIGSKGKYTYEYKDKEDNRYSDKYFWGWKPTPPQEEV